jgi:putative ABC transport system permease protein
MMREAARRPNRLSIAYDSLRLGGAQFFRTLRRHPAYVVTLVLTIALGVGANAAVFGLADWYLHRPLSGVAAPDRLVTLRAMSPQGVMFPISEVERRDLAAGAVAFAVVAGVMPVPVHVQASAAADPARLDAQLVAGDYFGALGPASLAMGRSFTDQELAAGRREQVAVISHRFWQGALGGAPSALGAAITINGARFAVVGIAREGFAGAERTDNADLWLPLGVYALVAPGSDDATLLSRRSPIYLSLIARLASGAHLERAVAYTDELRKRWALEEPSNRRLQRYRFVGTTDLEAPPWERDRLRLAFRVLQAMVGLLLLLTCANASNLILARARAGALERATREALGASRARLAMAAVLENILLSLIAAAAAVGVAWLLTGLLRGTLILPGLPPLGRIPVTRAVFLYAFALAALSAVIATVGPAWFHRGAATGTVLRSSGRSLTPASRRVRRLLLVAQIGFSVAMLIGAVLLDRSLRARRNIDTGFRTEGLLTFSIDPSLQNIDAAQQRTLATLVLARLRELPGVAQVSTSWTRPYGNDLNEARMRPADVPGGGLSEAEYGAIGTDYAATLRLSMLDGRDFLPAEVQGDGRGPDVLIVNASLARSLFGTVRAAGRFVEMDAPRKGRRQIVGVMPDVRLRVLEDVPPLQAYAPFRPSGRLNVLVQLRRPAAEVTPEIRKVVQSLAPSLPIYDVMTMDEAVARYLAEYTLLQRLARLFALLAIAVSAIGVYAVFSQATIERTVEFGIRAALGSSPLAVLRVVIAEAALLTAFGVGLGVIAAVWLGRLLQQQLYGVSAHDPASFAAAAAIVLLATVAGAAIPARRAATVDPLVALRS